MKLSVRDYTQALFEVVSERPADSKLIIQHFLTRLTLDRNHSLLPLILEELDKLQAEQDNQLLVEVTTAEPLTAEQGQLIIQQLSTQTQKSVILRENLDSTLIGGVKLKIDDRLIDNSIQTKLTQLAVQL